jgi:hypothetical protein
MAKKMPEKEFAGWVGKWFQSVPPALDFHAAQNTCPFRIPRSGGSGLGTAE